MSPNLSLLHDGKKYMWDGHFYATQDEAACAAATYLNDNFEILQREEDGKFLVYTRREVKNVVVTSQ